MAETLSKLDFPLLRWCYHLITVFEQTSVASVVIRHSSDLLARWRDSPT